MGTAAGTAGARCRLPCHRRSCHRSPAARPGRSPALTEPRRPAATDCGAADRYSLPRRTFHREPAFPGAGRAGRGSARPRRPRPPHLGRPPRPTGPSCAPGPGATADGSTAGCPGTYPPWSAPPGPPRPAPPPPPLRGRAAPPHGGQQGWQDRRGRTGTRGQAPAGRGEGGEPWGSPRVAGRGASATAGPRGAGAGPGQRRAGSCPPRPSHARHATPPAHNKDGGAAVTPARRQGGGQPRDGAPRSARCMAAP